MLQASAWLVHTRLCLSCREAAVRGPPTARLLIPRGLSRDYVGIAGTAAALARHVRMAARALSNEVTNV
jgi:hypothetical protein